jgi:2-keto-4-pentenoate hydratase/2-oxohepta-3-ene-1,7-dioic acid hydratase in catechol pathway
VALGPGKAKDWDGSNVLGPCIVTADEIDPHDVELEVRVNGDRWGGANTKDMHHTFESMIAYASQALTLHPGEVLGSGTATGGSGSELGRWLAAGDVVEMEASGIGVLRNTIGSGPS